MLTGRGTPLDIVEQNFDFDLLTPQKLLDVNRLNALGWRPRIALREGIAGAYGWFQEHAAAPAV